MTVVMVIMNIERVQLITITSLARSKGAQTNEIRRSGDHLNALYGKGSSYSKSDAGRFFHKLVTERILFEELTVTQQDYVVAYLRLGPKAAPLMNGAVKVCFQSTFPGLFCP